MKYAQIQNGDYRMSVFSAISIFVLVCILATFIVVY